tara:strand:- start:1069 stop:2892 length:1824 start_codon:yes stop_codon:yes gene_type:complete
VKNKVKKKIKGEPVKVQTKSPPVNTMIPSDLLSKAPYFPEESPFSGDQKLWISGFLEGLKQNTQKSNKDDDKQKTLISFLYGTQTGNSETLARNAAELAEKNNFATKLMPLDDVSMENLQSMQNAIFIVSTYGEGEMPDNAQLFWESLSADTAPKLHEMNFGVLALGDTGYDEFCNAGKLIDFRLEQLGAKRLISRVDCDVDFESPSQDWISSALPLFNDGEELTIQESKLSEEKVGWNKQNPFFAEVSENKLLSGNASNKEIRHYEIELGDSGIDYDVGDTLNVFPLNSKRLVNLILQRLNVNKKYKPKGFKNSIQYLLLHDYEISTPSKNFVEEINDILKNKQFENLIKAEEKENLEKFLWGKDILDILNLNVNAKISAEKFLNLLKPLQPRAYSISSSPRMHENQVHLTISSVKWENSERTHEGVCSNFLANSETSISKVGVYISQNKSFRLPEDDSAPIIMIGPGTGLAPFRAFLEERKVRGAKGKNWLFFGDQTRKNDFIYENEITDFEKSGLLTKLDLAFSRDQKNKIYVQHRMMENADEFFKWIDEGAYIYVCGDATYMAKDVDKALFDIVKKHGKFNDSRAKDYIDNIKKEKRYLRDVY